MNTDNPDNNAEIAGWLFYDGSCQWCRQSARRTHKILRNRSFRLRPLQSPEAARQLGLTNPEALEQVRLLLADGRHLDGADAILEIARHIWWAWPFWLLSRAPGAKPVLRAMYRVLAANRHCMGGACQIPKRRNWRAWLPLLVLPAAAMTCRPTLPAWVFMWLMAFSIYAGFKWLTYCEAPVEGRSWPARTRWIYLLGWPGMSLREFAEKPAGNERGASVLLWFAAATKTLVGAALVWLLVPSMAADAWLLRGWVGMIGIIMMLHFGAFHLLALTLQAAGFNAPPNMQAPLLARSLADFWGNRWNTAFSVLADRYGFGPLTRSLGPRAALVIVFLGSGVLHEAVITLPAGVGYGLPTLYFALQAAGIFAERLPLFRRQRWLKRLAAWGVLLVPLGCLFPPGFVRHVISPMLQAMGATEMTP